VRNADELRRIVAYIENNPVKAGSVASPELYRWSSAFVDPVVDAARPAAYANGARMKP
jgi:hypothetical protein